MWTQNQYSYVDLTGVKREKEERRLTTELYNSIKTG